jgi:hypothetical protein
MASFVIGQHGAEAQIRPKHPTTAGIYAAESDRSARTSWTLAVSALRPNGLRKKGRFAARQTDSADDPPEIIKALSPGRSRARSPQRSSPHFRGISRSPITKSILPGSRALIAIGGSQDNIVLAGQQHGDQFTDLYVVLDEQNDQLRLLRDRSISLSIVKSPSRGSPGLARSTHLLRRLTPSTANRF